MKMEVLKTDENPLEGALSKEDYLNLINTQIDNVQKSLGSHPIKDLILSLINWPKELLHCYDRYLVFKD